MQKNILIIVIGGVAVIGAVTAAGYYLGNTIGKPEDTALNTSPSPTPSAEPTEVSSVSPLPTVSPSPSLLPTAPPQRPIVKAATTSNPTTSNNTANAEEKSQDVSIRFVDTPSSVNSGEAFNVNWYISGPEGKNGTYTKVSTSRKVGTSSGTSSSYSSSETSQAFGEFTLPQKFVSNMNFSGNSGTIEVKVIAEIDGKTYSASRSINLNN